MITKIYCGDIIPILEEKLPIDVHSIIGKFLGFKHEIFIYMNLIINPYITENMKKFIYYDCFPRYKMYESNIDIDYLFEKTLVDNINNITEIHKILPIFYRKVKPLCSKKYIDCSEYKKIDNYLTNGFEMVTEYEMFKSHIYTNYNLHSKPLIGEITKQQVMIAFLSQNLPFHEEIEGDFFNIKVEAYYKNPTEKRLDNYLKKLKMKPTIFTKHFNDEIDIIYL